MNGVGAAETSCHTEQRIKRKPGASFSGPGPRHIRVRGRTQKAGIFRRIPAPLRNPAGDPPRPDPTRERVPARARPIAPTPIAPGRPLPVAQSRRPALRLPAAMPAPGEPQKPRTRTRKNRRPLLALPEREAARGRADGKPGAEGGGGAGRPPPPSATLRHPLRTPPASASGHAQNCGACVELGRLRSRAFKVRVLPAAFGSVGTSRVGGFLRGRSGVRSWGRFREVRSRLNLEESEVNSNPA